MQKLPTTRFKRTDLLGVMLNVPGANTTKYIDVWQPLEERVLKAIQKVTGLEFAQSPIDIYIIDGTRKVIRYPMILGGNLRPNEFVRSLTHELIHRNISENTEGVNWHSKAQEIYPDEPIRVSNHVLVHALLKAVFEELGMPEQIVMDIEDCQDYPDYKRAWEIVKKEGYKNIIARICV